ncbi:glycosyltransferase family 4 protein [Leptodesmis sichuanensis]|uniref:glycosyltransferase family 4 protein n=1 Tax=Leptodesmis sichuanensis TaxID=2906798 RepID=UPI001F1EBC74|nr:glycosyltransferase family 4 protein [Leptodesmis sichuanensis]UIE36567.1 glycosyltransferase family 4 protein [Leptodesmis sichuanensis A121]
MRITFVLPTPDMGGGMRVIALYASLLQKRGHEVYLVAVPPAQPSLQERIKSFLKQEQLLTDEIQLGHFERLGLTCHVLERYRPVTDADVPDADVVIATWWETAEWVMKLSRSKGAKVYYIQHYEMFDYLPRRRVEATYQMPLHKITVANWIRDTLMLRFGDRDISLVVPSVDTQQFFAPKRDKQAVPTVGMMYGHTSWKGCDIAFKALELAAQRIPDLRLVAFGFGQSLELPFLSQLHYDPWPEQHQLRDYYSACDAWLFPSRYEAVGLPILEAMACRTPVIGTPAGIAPEMLSDGAGILVKPEDPEDMARAIEQIHHFSNSTWQVMSDVAYNKVTGYTWNDATSHFEAALHQAIERQSPKRRRLISLSFSR